MGCAEGRLGSLDLGRRRPGNTGLPQNGATVLSQSPCCSRVERRSIPGSVYTLASLGAETTWSDNTLSSLPGMEVLRASWASEEVRRHNRVVILLWGPRTYFLDP